MNLQLVSLEIAVVLIGLLVLLVDLWTPREGKRSLGQIAALGLLLVLAQSIHFPFVQGVDDGAIPGFALDPLARFFKHIFIAAAIFVLVMVYLLNYSVDFDVFLELLSSCVHSVNSSDDFLHLFRNMVFLCPFSDFVG